MKSVPQSGISEGRGLAVARGETVSTKPQQVYGPEDGLQQRSTRLPEKESRSVRRLILRSFQSPGDILMLTAAVRDLHAAYPQQFETDVRTSADALWENNPLLTRLQEREAGVETIDMHYPLVHHSNQRPYHFIHGYAQFLEQQLDLRIPIRKFCGDLYLSEQERTAPLGNGFADIPERFWIIVAGGKHDFTAKWWNPASYQQVVDHFQGRITFVQCGEAGHWHPPLENVVNLVGKTTLREFVRLMHFADGVICPVTLAMHLAAAVETRPALGAVRPCVVIAGGREPPHWEAYPQHRFLSTVGMLSCCATGGCWKSRCQLVGDGDPKDRRNVCEQPIAVRPDLHIPRCMDMISPDDVIRQVELYLDGLPAATSVEFSPEHSKKGRQDMEAPETKTIPRSADEETATGGRHSVLLKFRHGLGDAVQVTSLLQHLHHYHANWDIDVAALPGKRSAFHGLARQIHELNASEISVAEYDEVIDLEWPECASCYADWPSTKCERALLEVFHLSPISELCRYKLVISSEANELARRWIERVCGVRSGGVGRYPLVLIHYQGNTSQRHKDLPEELAARLCDEIIDIGFVPVILDWDFRSQLPDGERIHCPHVDLEIWGGIGTGDAEVLAALTSQSALMIGIDSGPLHVAAATDTPTIGVWTGHHPLHYIALADNITHLIPENHQQLLRGDRRSGLSYFERSYRFQTYVDLEPALLALVRERLGHADGGLVYTRGFWIRTNNAEQDLVVVKDIAEDDSYRIDDLPLPAPVIIDVGAHIGCFSRAIHRQIPRARVIAVECCRDNIEALRRNAGEFAEIVPAALTYEQDVGLLNAVFPNCLTTGGSMIIGRAELMRRVEGGELVTSPAEAAKADGNGQANSYWADLRPVESITLEQLCQQHGIEQIDVLKLDCEGSEFSILEHTSLLDRIRCIVGEYHGRDQFHELVRRKFAEWDLVILREGELGTFRLINPGTSTADANVPVRATRRRTQIEMPLLVEALVNEPGPAYVLLRLEGDRKVAEYRHPEGYLRGFARHDGSVWTIDSFGRLYRVHVRGDTIELENVAESDLAIEAHDLVSHNGCLVTVSPPESAIVSFNPRDETWSLKRPWIPVVGKPGQSSSDRDVHHVNSLLPDSDGYLLSLFAADRKPTGVRWRAQLQQPNGLIVRWGPDGFSPEPLASELYAPHSLRRHGDQVWWCDSFRQQVCRSDGWRSPALGGFARGLTFADGKCIVGLSRSRVHPLPESDLCGLCIFDPNSPDDRSVHQFDLPLIEVYAVMAMSEEER